MSFGFPDYRLPQVQSDARIPTVNVDAPFAAFGGNVGAAMERAGARVEQAANTVQGIYEKEAAIANETKVEEDLNQFISAKQYTLYTAPDAFFRTKGEQAIHGAQTATDKLIDLKKEALSRATNDLQRLALGKRIDAHINAAGQDIANHVSRQSDVWQETTAKARLAVINTESVAKSNDIDALKGQAQAAYDTGLELARIKFGASPDSEVAKVMAAEEASKVYKTAIQVRLDQGNKRSALTLYDRVKDNIGLKQDHALAAQMNGVRTDVNGERAVNEALVKVGLPPVTTDDLQSQQRRDDAVTRLQKAGYSPEVAKGIAANFEHESGFSTRAVNKGDGSDGSDSIGLGQWNGPRAKALNSFAKSQGLDPADPDTQIAYMKAELDGTIPQSVSGISPGLKARLENAKTSGEAAALMSREYFKPRAASEADSRAATASGYATPGQVYKGDLKSGFQEAANSISNRTDLSTQEKSSALALLNKQQTQITGYRDSQIKSLRDEVNSTLAVAYLQPDSLKPGQLASYADKAQALGESELATRYRVLAAMEGTIKNGLQMAPADQVEFLKSISEGLAKQVLEGAKAGNADLAARAASTFEKLKQAQRDGLSADGMVKLAAQSAQDFATAGKGEKAQEVRDWMAQASVAGHIATLPPEAQQRAMTELGQTVASGKATEQNLALYHLMKEGMARQNAAFSADALDAGSKLYNLPIQPVDWAKPLAPQLAGRQQIADQINATRPGANALPLTQPEIASLKSTLDQGNAQTQTQVLRQLGGAVQPQSIPAIAAALAGKEEGNQLSRSYAAAMSFLADPDQAQQVVGEQILRGAQILKEGGAGGRKPAETSDAWQSALQDRIGNVFKDMGAKVPATITDAVASVYVSKMWAAGRPGDKTDPDVLDASIKAVVGETITRNGQALLPPRGVDSYSMDRAVRSLTDADLKGINTLNGSPVTADKVIRYGRLSNSGGEGRYFVAIPDPSRGGDPGYLTLPDGKPYILDIRPLLERQQTNPAVPEIDALAARRRAPASPTAGVTP